MASRSVRVSGITQRDIQVGTGVCHRRHIGDNVDRIKLADYCALVAGTVHGHEFEGDGFRNLYRNVVKDRSGGRIAAVQGVVNPGGLIGDQGHVLGGIKGAAGR